MEATYFLACVFAGLTEYCVESLGLVMIPLRQGLQCGEVSEEILLFKMRIFCLDIPCVIGWIFGREVAMSHWCKSRRFVTKERRCIKVDIEPPMVGFNSLMEWFVATGGYSLS